MLVLCVEAAANVPRLALQATTPWRTGAHSASHRETCAAIVGRSSGSPPVSLAVRDVCTRIQVQSHEQVESAAGWSRRRTMEMPTCHALSVAVAGRSRIILQGGGAGRSEIGKSGLKSWAFCWCWVRYASTAAALGLCFIRSNLCAKIGAEALEHFWSSAF